jgi:dTDP-glucose 4,6-dehydratase
LQISTDEVYGPAGDDDCFGEDAPLSPTSPYAASKAAADLLVMAAIKTFRQNAAIVRTCNNYGPRQFPEKIIPFFVYLAQKREPLMLYGDGQQRRSWLHVDDFCDALSRVIDDFPAGEIINIGSQTEVPNQIVAQKIAEAFPGTEIEYITDRPAHDRRYRIDSTKFTARYGEISERDFASGLKATLKWYLENPSVFQLLSSNDSRAFRERHYHKKV